MTTLAASRSVRIHLNISGRAGARTRKRVVRSRYLKSASSEFHVAGLKPHASALRHAHAFYRLLRIEPRNIAKLGSGGAEVFGYTDAFSAELQRIVQISPWFESTYVNPRPEAEIASIDFVSTFTACSPQLAAITLE